jgi:uncharacterized protein YndB with AHSA1/START domain
VSSIIRPETEAITSSVVIERTYRAPLEELWALWTTSDGFESWWGPEGFRTKVHALEARADGVLSYTMSAYGLAQVAAMKELGRSSSHAVNARFTEFEPMRRLLMTNVIDFLPGIAAYESTIAVDFLPGSRTVRMVITLDALHSEEFTRMSTTGFTSQLTKLDQRFRD